MTAILGLIGLVYNDERQTSVFPVVLWMAVKVFSDFDG